eukprot:4113745-Pyramimonas_sp.AAC.1
MVGRLVHIPHNSVSRCLEETRGILHACKMTEARWGERVTPALQAVVSRMKPSVKKDVACPQR